MSQLRNSIIANLGGSTPPTPTPVDTGILKLTLITTANNQNTGFTASNVADYVVDWGDGTTTTGSSIKTYSTAGTYHVEIKKGSSGNFPKVTFENSIFLTSIDSPIPYMYNTTNLSYFASSTALASVDENLFYFNPQLENLNFAFMGTKLSSLSAKLLKPITALSTCISIFNGCTLLTSIPGGFFDYNTNLTRLMRGFYGCTSLTTIPDLLFANNSQLYDFSNTFNGCTNLKIPTNLFCNDSTERTTRFATVIDLTFANCFYRDSYMGTDTMTVPELWNYTYTGTPDKYNCFAGSGNNSNNITNYSSIPSVWGGPAS